ncbi:MAG TPA: FAD-dependent oxidoreductase [Planctomycetota bacterium]|jgi:D-arginine dehydrogenase
MSDRRVVIAGAGFAGAATAYHLARAGFKHVVLLEREELPGMHASGRNAGMIRQIVPENSIAALAREGCRFIHAWAREHAPHAFQVNGSMLLASGAAVEPLRTQVAEAQRGGTDVQILSHAEATARVPVLKTALFDIAAWCPSDGVVDIAALLQFYISESRKLGVQISTRKAVDAVEHRGGKIAGVRCGKETMPCDVLINAAGAWANEIAGLAGAAKLPMKAYRRHIVVTTPMSVDRSWPFVWNVSEQVYFRPEQPGLLLSPCDQTEHAPGTPATDESAFDLLATKLAKCMPALTSIKIGRSWAGLRTITTDGNFAIGWDSKVQGLFWLAGLGGHGVTCGAGIGRLACEIIGGGKAHAEFRPERFGN